MLPSYDVIVLGAGGVGSAAAWRMATRGARVLALDAHHPPHSLGSSHGQTRAIRMAYFEHPDYVPLLRRAYALWDELQARVGKLLFDRCGLLQVGPADGRVVSGVLRAAAEHDLPVRNYTPDQARSAFPQFHIHHIKISTRISSPKVPVNVSAVLLPWHFYLVQKRFFP